MSFWCKVAKPIRATPPLTPCCLFFSRAQSRGFVMAAGRLAASPPPTFRHRPLRFVHWLFCSCLVPSHGPPAKTGGLRTPHQPEWLRHNQPRTDTHTHTHTHAHNFVTQTTNLTHDSNPGRETHKTSSRETNKTNNNTTTRTPTTHQKERRREISHTKGIYTRTPPRARKRKHKPKQYHTKKQTHVQDLGIRNSSNRPNVISKSQTRVRPCG